MAAAPDVVYFNCCNFFFSFICFTNVAHVSVDLFVDKPLVFDSEAACLPKSGQTCRSGGETKNTALGSQGGQMKDGYLKHPLS